MRKDWTETTLGNSSDIQMGQSPDGSTYNSEGNGLPFMQGSAEFGEHFPKPEKWCSEPKKVAEFGDLLLSVRAPVGDTNFADQRIAVGRGLSVIRGKAGHSIAEFLRLSIQLNVAEMISSSGTGMFSSITGQNLRDFLILLPPLQEQKRIVDLISSVDSYIDALHQQADSARKSRKAILHEVMSAGGEGWTERTLKEVSDVVMGRQLSPDKKKGVRPRPYIRAANIGSWGIDMEDILEMDFTAQEEEKFASQIGDTLLVEGGNEKSVGCPALVTRKEVGLCIQNTVIRCRSKDVNVLDPTFQYHFLRFRYWAGEFAELCAGTTIMHLGQKRAELVKIQIPPLAEQIAIVSSIESLDLVIRNSELLLISAGNLRSGLLSELLSGQHEIPVSYDSIMGAAR
jgi:type I restriction enzyme S subunit